MFWRNWKDFELFWLTFKVNHCVANNCCGICFSDEKYHLSPRSQTKSWYNEKKLYRSAWKIIIPTPAANNEYNWMKRTNKWFWYNYYYSYYFYIIDFFNLLLFIFLSSLIFYLLFLIIFSFIPFLLFFSKFFFIILILYQFMSLLLIILVFLSFIFYFLFITLYLLYYRIFLVYSFNHELSRFNTF